MDTWKYYADLNIIWYVIVIIWWCWIWSILPRRCQLRRLSFFTPAVSSGRSDQSQSLHGCVLCSSQTPFRWDMDIAEPHPVALLCRLCCLCIPVKIDIMAENPCPLIYISPLSEWIGQMVLYIKELRYWHTGVCNIYLKVCLDITAVWFWRGKRFFNPF